MSNKRLKEYFPDFESNDSYSIGNSSHSNLTLYDLDSYLSEFLSTCKYSASDQSNNNYGMLSYIRTKLLNLLFHVNKLQIKKDWCDGCATFTEIKIVGFRDSNGQPFKINECKECFESDWKMDWDSYIEDLIILHQ